MFEIKNDKQGNYVAHWKEYPYTTKILIGIFENFSKCQEACDEYWDREIFPTRKKQLAKYR